MRGSLTISIVSVLVFFSPNFLATGTDEIEVLDSAIRLQRDDDRSSPGPLPAFTPIKRGGGADISATQKLLLRQNSEGKPTLKRKKKPGKKPADSGEDGGGDGQNGGCQTKNCQPPPSEECSPASKYDRSVERPSKPHAECCPLMKCYNPDGSFFSFHGLEGIIGGEQTSNNERRMQGRRMPSQAQHDDVEDPSPFQRGPNKYGRSKNNFGGSPNNFRRNPNNFGSSFEDNSFDGGPNDFNMGRNNFDMGSNNYNMAPNNYDNSPYDYGRGQNNYNRGPNNFDRGSNNFGGGSNNYGGGGQNNFGGNKMGGDFNNDYNNFNDDFSSGGFANEFKMPDIDYSGFEGFLDADNGNNGGRKYGLSKKNVSKEGFGNDDVIVNAFDGEEEEFEKDLANAKEDVSQVEKYHDKISKKFNNNEDNSDSNSDSDSDSDSESDSEEDRRKPKGKKKTAKGKPKNPLGNVLNKLLG